MTKHKRHNFDINSLIGTMDRMNGMTKQVQRTYLTITLLQTLAASFIWGINTLFLLDAGLSNTEAFAANAFFTLGMVIFEVPTGVVADTWGRRTSFLLGAGTLLLSTLLYLLMWDIEATFIWWAVASALIGLGFTFFDLRQVRGLFGSHVCQRPGNRWSSYAGRISSWWLYRSSN